jgi:hypothetical protein
VDLYEPIMQVECTQCTTTPVVGLRAPSGMLISTGLCGPHFFGDRSMIDSDEWNKPQEGTE